MGETVQWAPGQSSVRVGYSGSAPAVSTASRDLSTEAGSKPRRSIRPAVSGGVNRPNKVITDVVGLVGALGVVRARVGLGALQRSRGAFILAGVGTRAAGAAALSGVIAGSDGRAFRTAGGRGTGVGVWSFGTAPLPIHRSAAFSATTATGPRPAAVSRAASAASAAMVASGRRPAHTSCRLSVASDHDGQAYQPTA